MKHEFNNLLSWCDMFLQSGVLASEGEAKLKADIDAARNVINDSIFIQWGVEDVLQRAEEIDVAITEDEAREVLGELEDNHDCNWGISWETMDSYLYAYQKQD